MPFLLSDDAADQATQRLQDYATGLLQPLQQAAGGIQQNLNDQAAQAQQNVADATTRLQHYATGLLQPLTQNAPVEIQQNNPNGLQNITQRLQDFGAQVVNGATQTASQALTPLQPVNNQAPDQAQSQAFGQPGGPLQDYARAAAQRAGIDPDIFVRQIQQESGFNPSAKSPAGALGIAQFMPATAAGVGVDPTDPYASLDAAARMDARNLAQYDGDWAKTLAAYNAGPGAVAQYNGVPPYAETQAYVQNILQGVQDLVNQGKQAANRAVGGDVFPVQGYDGQIADHWGSVKGGSDIMAARGTPVVAMRGGKVIESGWNSVGGNSVLIKGDDGLEYYYAHGDQAPSVKVGDNVPAGTYLMPVGNTGDAQGGPTHLHIGIGPDILLGADKYGGTGGDFDAVGLLRRTLQGTPDTASGPQSMAPPTADAVQAAASSTLNTLGQAKDRGMQILSQAVDYLGTPQSTRDIYNNSPSAFINDQLGKIGPALGAPSGGYSIDDVLNARKAIGRGIEDLANQPPANPNIPSVGLIPDEVIRAGGRALGQFLQQPGPIESMQIIQDLNAKYNQQQGLAGGFTAPNPDLMTPEDRQAYTNALLTVGAVAAPLDVGANTTRMFHGTSAAYDRPGLFNDESMYGPGYYMTTDPRVAGGTVRGAVTGPQIVPEGTVTQRGYAQEAMPPGFDERAMAIDEERARNRLLAAQQNLEYARQNNNPFQETDAQHYIDRAQQDLAEIAQERTDAMQATSGPNVRAVDVPKDLALLDTERYVDPEALQSVREVVGETPSRLPVFDGQVARAFEGRPTGQQLYEALTAAWGRGYDAYAAANKTLAEAGFDGITYPGGRIMPLVDEAGNEIRHTATVVFPESLDKLRNVVSGRQGGEVRPEFATLAGAGGLTAAALYKAINDPSSNDILNALGVANPLDSRNYAGMLPGDQGFTAPNIGGAIGGAASALGTAAHEGVLRNLQTNLGIGDLDAEQLAQRAAAAANEERAQQETERVTGSRVQFPGAGEMLGGLLPFGGGGPSPIGTATPGDVLEAQINQAVAENNPLRNAPGPIGPVSTFLEQQLVNPTNIAALGLGAFAGMRPGPALESLLREPSVARFVTDEAGNVNYGKLAQLFQDALRSRTGPSEGPIPHGMAVPETGYAAGTPEYATESALRQAAADQATSRPNLTQAELQALPGMAGSHLSDLNELREAVQTGLPAMRWYTEMANQIAQDTGQTINPREAAVLMGATAGNSGVGPNYHSMLSVFRAMRLANPDLTGFESLDNKAIQNTQAFKDVLARVQELKTYVKPYDLARIMQGYRTGEIPYPSGAKLSSYTTNFLHALSDLYDPYTTQDVWQGRLMGSRLVPDPANPNKLIESVASPTITNDPTYRTAHSLTNWIARELNINPREAQAAGWGVIRSLWNDEAIGPQLQTGQISLRDALKQGMQQGMFDPRQLQAGMLADVTGGLGTQWDAKIAQARDLIQSEGLFNTPPPPTATGVESMSAIHPANWKDAQGLNKADIPRAVSEPLATALGDIARTTAPVIRVPGTLEGNRVPNLLLEHQVQRAGDNSYVHLVGAGDAAAQDVASKLGGDAITHYDPQVESLGGYTIDGLGADQNQQLARQLRMNGVPVVEAIGGRLNVPIFEGDLGSDILATIKAGIGNLGPEATADLGYYTGTTHPVAGVSDLAGVAGGETAAAGRPDLPIWASDQGAAQNAIQDWLAGRQPAAASSLFAAHLGGAAAGGLAANATTPENASPEERALRIAAGVGAGAFAPTLLTNPGLAGRMVQSARVGSLAGGIPTLSHIAFNLPVQTGLKLAADLPMSVLTSKPGSAASELYGILQGFRSWALGSAGALPYQGAAQALAQAGPLARSMGGGLGAQTLETALTGLVRLHPVMQDMAGQVASHMDLWKTAADQATRVLGRTAQFSGPWRQMVATLVANPTPAMLESADAAAQRAGLNMPLGSIGKWVQSGVDRTNPASPIIRFMLPIWQKGYSIATQGMELTPIGWAGMGLDVARGLANQGPYAGGNWAGRGAAGAVTPLAQRFRNAMIGLALMYEGYNQAAAGNVTGEGPSDPKQQASLRESGWQPDSSLVAGRYVNNHLLGPVGWALSAGANAYEATHGPQVAGQPMPQTGLDWITNTQPQAGGFATPKATPQGEKPPDLTDILGDLAARQGRFFTNETFLSSLGNALNLIGSSNAQGQLPAREASSVAESLIPQGGLLANIASAQDPYQRVTRAQDPLTQIQQAVQSRLPGAREQLAPRLGITGQPLPNPQQGAGLLVPRSTVVTGEPILREMQSLGITPIQAPKTVPYGPQNDIQLTPQEQQQWETYRGQILQDTAGKLINSAAYQKMSETNQRNALAKTASTAASAADKKMLADFAKTPAASRARMIAKGASAPVYSYAPTGDLSTSLSQQLAGAGVSP